jgi:hypothetical protein
VGYELSLPHNLVFSARIIHALTRLLRKNLGIRLSSPDSDRLFRISSHFGNMIGRATDKQRTFSRNIHQRNIIRKEGEPLNTEVIMDDEEYEAKRVASRSVLERIPARTISTILFWAGVIFPIVTVGNDVYSILSAHIPFPLNTPLFALVSELILPLTTGAMLVGIAKLIEVGNSILASMPKPTEDENP